MFLEFDRPLLVLQCGISAGLAVLLTRSLLTDLRKEALWLVQASKRLHAYGEDALSSSQRLESTVNQEAQAMLNTGQTVDRLLQALEAMADEVSRAREHSQSVARQTDRGLASMEDMERAIASVAQAAESLESMDRILENVSEKTDIINEIVFKTQMLSFNASIEAAHAGVHGRGFAVVAEEVGNLALLSGGAAEETRILLSRSRAEVTSVTEELRSRMNRGVDSVSAAVADLREIVASNHALHADLAKTSQRIPEQLGAVQETRVALHQLSQALDASLQAAVDDARTAHDLERQGSRLAEVASRLQCLLEGKSELAQIEKLPTEYCQASSS